MTFSRVDIRFRLVADSYDLVGGGGVLDGLDHEIGHIRARDIETEKRQPALLHAVLSGVSLVCTLGRTHHRPVELAFPEDALHGRCVGNGPWKKQSPEKVGWRHDGILEQQRY